MVSKKTIIIIAAAVLAVVAAFVIVRNHSKHSKFESDGAIYISQEYVYKLDKGQRAKGTTRDGHEIEFWVQ